MFIVTKTFRVPVGHRLSLHLGLCKNVHGHNLKLEVSVKSNNLNPNWMVIDFSDLKKIVNKIIEKWDHTLLLNENDHEFINATETITKILTIPGEPTAENLCYRLFTEIQTELKICYSPQVMNFVRIWESDDAYSEYNGEEQ